MNSKDIKKLQDVIKNKQEVGYCKAPKSGQFKPGVSGNPRGRKPKIVPKSLYEALQLELANKVDITNNSGVREKITTFELLAKMMVQDALKLDKHSRKLLVEVPLKSDLIYARESIIDSQTRYNKETSQEELELRNKLLDKLDVLYREKAQLEEEEQAALQENNLE